MEILLTTGKSDGNRIEGVQEQRSKPAELKGALKGCAGALAGIGVFSAVVNILALTGPLYMLQVYDRVLPSHSIPTLVGITIAMLGLYVAYGLLDFVRLRLLARIGNRFYRSFEKSALAVSLLLPLKMGQEGARIQPIRDLDKIRSFVSGMGPTAFFDLPWIPFYLLLIYLLHPLLGVLATIGAFVIIFLTLFAEFIGRSPAKRAAESSVERSLFADAGRRNAEIIRAMGLGERFCGIWSRQNSRFIEDQRRMSDVVGAAGAVSRVLRMTLQSLMLGLGAYLVVAGEASGGVIIASSVMLGRSLAPVDVAIANWKSFIAARQSYKKLKETLQTFTDTHVPMALPRPVRSLSVEALTVAPPGQQKPVIFDVTFALQAGQGLGIVGPSASGKSTLVRALVGAWPALSGIVRLDDAAQDQWSVEALGRDIGYLPQDIELFEGTVAENICRFDGASDPKDILAAANAAGVQHMILKLPQGFQTRVGAGGMALSAGQRQLIGLARALYGDPFLVVLDEPNSNLDADGDVSLTTAVRSVRQRGGIVIVVAHRPSALVSVNHMLVMVGGAVQAFGPKPEVLAQVTGNGSRAAAKRPGRLGEPAASGGTPTVVSFHERRS